MILLILFYPTIPFRLLFLSPQSQYLRFRILFQKVHSHLFFSFETLQIPFQRNLLFIQPLTFFILGSLHSLSSFLPLILSCFCIHLIELHIFCRNLIKRQHEHFLNKVHKAFKINSVSRIPMKLIFYEYLL